MNSKKNLLKLFATAYIQVLLVAANTYFISKIAWLGIAVCGFGISYMWTLNVKKISAGSGLERVVYSTGAMLGGLTGVAISKYLIALLPC